MTSPNCPYGPRVFGCIIPQPHNEANSRVIWAKARALDSLLLHTVHYYKAMMEKEYPETIAKRGRAENG